MRCGPASGGDRARLGFVFLGCPHLGSGVLGAATVTPDTWRCRLSVPAPPPKPCSLPSSAWPSARGRPESSGPGQVSLAVSLQASGRGLCYNNNLFHSVKISSYSAGKPEQHRPPAAPAASSVCVQPARGSWGSRGWFAGDGVFLALCSSGSQGSPRGAWRCGLVTNRQGILSHGPGAREGWDLSVVRIGRG